jgi:hypothetical protein
MKTKHGLFFGFAVLALAAIFTLAGCGDNGDPSSPPFIPPGGGGETTVPGVPAGVTATAQSSSSISVTWNSVSGATSYEVYYEIGSSTTKNLAGTVSGTSYTHTGLQASTTYYYYIKATNSAGSSGYSSYDYATTQSSGGGTNVPSAPTGVTATAQSSSSIRVTWNSVNGATSYKVYWAKSSYGTYDLDGTTTTTSWTSNGWYPSSTGYFKVTAVNSAGESNYSSVAYATTQSSGGGGTTEYRIAQAIFGTCSKSGNNLVFNWTLQTSGTTPNGLYTYTSPSNIVVSVQVDGSYYDLQTLAGSARTYTLNNFSAWAVNGRVYFRVKCVSNYNETISYNAYLISANTFTPNYP